MKRVGFFTVVFLCSLVPLVLDAAPSVRRLGGVGTFNGSNKAEEAKANATDRNARTMSKHAKGTDKTVQTSLTHASSKSRLAIGKYLGGSSVLSGTVSKPSVNSNLSGATGGDELRDLQGSVDALENFVGYSETGDTLAETVTNLSDEIVRIDEIDKIVDENASGILELQEKLSEIAGEQIQISYENGVLTLIQPGVEPRSFDLLKDLGAQFANKTDVDNLKSRFEVFSDTFVDTSRNAVQTLHGQYSIKGEISVDTPALPPLN